MSGDDRADRRRRRPPPPSGLSALSIVLILGGIGLLLGLCVCGGIVGVVIYRTQSGGLGADLSEKNLARIQPGMTRTDAEKVLGRGRVVTQSDVNEAGLSGLAVMRPGCTKIMWRTGTTWFFIDVEDRSGKIVGMQRHSRRG